MKKTVFGVLNNRQQAEHLIERLKSVGFVPNDVSMLFADTTGGRDFAIKHETKAPEGATTGGTTGFFVGGALGWLAGIGTLAIPGLGAFIAAGPIMSALSGAAVGTAVGGIIGALVGMGMPEFEARRYEAKIKQGNILVSVHAEDAGRVDDAMAILKECNAQDVSTASETPVREERRGGRGDIGSEE